jgi:Uma2 family endonuclease
MDHTVASQWERTTQTEGSTKRDKTGIHSRASYTPNMTASARRLHHSYAEYLALEAQSSVRHEYWNGEIYATAGGTPDHAALAAALIGTLFAQLPKTCRAFSSDLRVYIEDTDLSTYPDVTVLCGKSVCAEKDAIAVTNPTLVAEITSPSTEDYDRGEKLRHYKSLASLKEILILSHKEPRITVHRREADGSWGAQDVLGGETTELSSTRVTIDVAVLYARALES